MKWDTLGPYIFILFQNFMPATLHWNNGPNLATKGADGLPYMIHHLNMSKKQKSFSLCRGM